MDSPTLQELLVDWSEDVFRLWLHLQAPIELTVDDDLVFFYNEGHSYEANFRRWYELNKDKRFHYKQKEYTEEEAREVFDPLYKRLRRFSSS
jgi:hypothetical protein